MWWWVVNDTLILIIVRFEIFAGTEDANFIQVSSTGRLTVNHKHDWWIVILKVYGASVRKNSASFILIFKDHYSFDV